MNPFVMTFEIMEPNRAAGRKFECRGFVRDPSSLSGYYEAKGNTVIESANLTNVIRLACGVPNRDSRAKAIVDCSGMNAACWITFVDAVALNLTDCAVAAEIDA